MMQRCLACAAFLWIILASERPVAGADPVAVDLSRYTPECGVAVRRDGDRIEVRWPIGEKEVGRAVLDLTRGNPLFESVGIAADNKEPGVALLQGVEPVTWITVGTRTVPKGRPPEMSIWNVFFDRPGARPFRTHVATRELKQVRVTSEGRRAHIAAGELTAGPFTGELVVTFYPGTRLIHVEAVVSTTENERAIIYDAGLVSPKAPSWRTFAWMGTDGRLQREAVNDKPGRALAVRHRAIIAESTDGAVACFPPPHQFHFPRDWTDNLKFVWLGKDHHGHASPGFGVRQEPDGKRAFEPWFNSPPGTKQRLGSFLLLSRGKAEDALTETLRYTHGDKFVPLPGQVTFTTHYHMAVAVQAMANKFQGTPDFVRVFKEMGVNSVHIADFHGDGHQKDPGPLRLPEMEAMFKECKRLSDGDFLVIPGEEVNDFLGIREPNKHPGHWMSLFPKPVYWIQQRSADHPFEEKHEQYGTVYRVGNQRDMMDLVKKEKGLVWAAHPRIKASSWTPDIFRREEFYLADYWLGGAWKAMPADLSRAKLGERCLDLMDDMANWGQKKYLPGEVDVFKIDRTHELYGHMNINYLKLDKLPRYADGWQPVLDVLQKGRFWTSTGEVLLHEFTVNGQESGSTTKAGPAEIRVSLEWTFPLAFAEIVSGDGKQVFRERITLNDTEPFGKRTLTLKPDLKGRKWLRLEVWDVAVNGAYSQPVWLE